jgi:hypothetical protein
VCPNAADSTSPLPAPAGGPNLADTLLAAIEQYGHMQEQQAGLHAALAAIWATPDISCLQLPGSADQRPDLAEAFLKLASGVLRQLPATTAAASGVSQLVEGGLVAGCACCWCNHKKAALGALSLVAAVVAAASEEGPHQRWLLKVGGGGPDG